MPTGVAIRDARTQLFDAAERVLLRDGPNALTSRAVTTEAGCAKGVLHRHFPGFDAFLAELVQHRIARIGDQAAALRDSGGTGTIAGNLTRALRDLFGPVTLAIVGLATCREELRARLRQAHPAGVPILAQATAMIASYLTTERDLGRITADADIDTLAPMLIGTGHLLFAGQQDTPPDAEALRKVVTTVIAGRRATTAAMNTPNSKLHPEIGPVQEELSTAGNSSWLRARTPAPAARPASS